MPQKDQRFGWIATLLLVSTVAAGCYSARIATGHRTGQRDTTFTTSWCFWRFASSEPEPIIGDERLNAMSDVEIYQNFGQKLVSVLTLGTYAPLTVHCYFEACDAETPR